jgi:hypothetical protein
MSSANRAVFPHLKRGKGLLQDRSLTSPAPVRPNADRPRTSRGALAAGETEPDQGTPVVAPAHTIDLQVCPQKQRHGCHRVTVERAAPLFCSKTPMRVAAKLKGKKKKNLGEKMQHTKRNVK